MKPQRARGTAGLVGLAVVLTVLTGCSPTAPQPLPTASWDGASPSGQLDGDPWVVATRAALEAEAIARNRNDFSLPALTETTGSVLRDRLYQAARDRVGNGQRTDVLPGPTPFGAVEVEASDDGESAVVRGCLASNWASPDGAVPAELESLGVEFHLERGDYGPQLVDSRSLNSLDCDSVELPVALLTPAPEPSEVGDTADIIRPGNPKD